MLSLSAYYCLVNFFLLTARIRVMAAAEIDFPLVVSCSPSGQIRRHKSPKSKNVWYLWNQPFFIRTNHIWLFKLPRQWQTPLPTQLNKIWIWNVFSKHVWLVASIHARTAVGSPKRLFNEINSKCKSVSAAQVRSSGA